MICKEYFPTSTHSRSADCQNCKYRGYGGDISSCRNVNVKIALQRLTKVIN